VDTPNISYQLAKFFKSRCKELNALVPLNAKSAATLLCLNSNTIYMGEFAELGPLDVQLSDEVERGKDWFSPLNEFKSMEFLREYATEFLDYFSWLLSERGMSVKQALHEAMPGMVGVMAPLYSHIDPSKLGSYRRSLAEGEEYAQRLLSSIGNPNAVKIARKLVWNYPAHDFVVDRDEARGLGLPVKPMDSQLDTILVNLVTELIENEISYTGFVAGPKTAGATRKKKQVQKNLPVSIEKAPRAAAS